MDKIRCIAVDDEPFALQILADDISKIETLHLLKTCQSAVETKRILDYIDFDLIFLDIRMPGFSGMQLISELPMAPMVIFTTAYEEYAVKAFELNVVDYLLKPICFERLAAATHKAHLLHQQRKGFQQITDEQDALYIKSEYQTVKILYSDILYIEGMKDYVKVFTQSRPNPVFTRMNVKGIQALLPEDRFCRVHQSYIISVQKIAAFQKRKLWILQKEIPIGSAFCDNLSRIYTNPRSMFPDKAG